MTAQRVAGRVILSLPFVALTALMWWVNGWRMVAFVWGVTAAIVACIIVGTELDARGGAK